MNHGIWQETPDRKDTERIRILVGFGEDLAEDHFGPKYHDLGALLVYHRAGFTSREELMAAVRYSGLGPDQWADFVEYANDELSEFELTRYRVPGE